MKKTKKALATLAIMCMVATMAPLNAFAATGVTTDRLYGATRIETAVDVAEEFGSATTAILAPSANENLVDALAAAPLAGKTSPILLTENDTLNAATKAELIKLGVTKVYVVGAISQGVADLVEDMTGVTAVVLKGDDRIATAAKINEQLVSPAGTFVVGYYALADALSVASFAAANNYAIVVANVNGTLPMASSIVGSKTYLVGGPTLVSDIAGATRLAGLDRFATNKIVLDTLYGASASFSKVYVSNGTDEHLVDSLAVASLAASASAPIVLTDTTTGGDAAAASVNAKLADNAVVVALGGSTVVSDATVAKVSTGVVPAVLAVSSVSAINAKEVAVTFNQPVTKSTVLDASNAVQNITFAAIGTASDPGALTGSLSADGKTLTITAAGSFSGDYTVVASKLILTTDSKALVEFKSVVSFEDTVRPTLGQAVYNANNVATFSFSEPINVADNSALATTLVLKDASGATYTPTVVLAGNKKSFTLDLNAEGFVTGKTYTLTATGLVDFAGNLITPNPVTLSVEKKVIDDVVPTVTSITSTQAGYVVVNFSEKVAANASNVVATVGTITADLDTNATLDASGTVLTVRDASYNGTKDIAVNSFTDVAGNAGTAKTTLVNFAVDSVKPTVSSSLVQVINNQNYLVINYSEDVTVTNAAGSITGTYVTENGVEKLVAPINTALAANVSSVSATKNQVKILIDTQEKGSYTVSVPVNVVIDIVGNQNAIASVVYTVGANTSETTKPTIADSTPGTADLDGIVVQSADKNTVVITFSEALATSSLNLNNFKVEGAAVAEKAVFTDDPKSAIKLTLKEGAIKTSGTYNFTVSNVADVAGNVMIPVTTQKAFVENGLPSLTAAALTSNDVEEHTSKITLTFDEAILATSIVENPALVADFDIFLDGVALTGATVVEAMGTSTNTVTLSINRDLTATEAAKVITIKPATGFAVTDLVGNALPTFTFFTVTK